jgi:hypothetical protein
MASVPASNLRQVQTFQRSNLVLLRNVSPFISSFNKKFREFNKLTANLGSTVTFDIPPQMSFNPSLVANFQGLNQPFQPLTVNQQGSVAFEATSPQLIFNVEQYLDMFGRAAMSELCANIEGYVAGLSETQPYRFYGDGVTAINSVNQLGQALARFRTTGTVHGTDQVYLPDVITPSIVANAANQFVPSRNEEYMNSWELGSWRRAEFMESNLLPVHTSGTTGIQGQTLTVISTNDPTGASITQITVSGASVSDPNAINQFDSFQINNNVFFRTQYGHFASAAPAQFSAAQNAGSNGSGNVTFNIYPALCAQAGNPLQNITQNIVSGMTITTYPSHRCGLMVQGNAGFLAMPELPDMDPFATGFKADDETGAAFRMYYGGIIPTGNVGYIYDAIWGATIVPRYCMKIMVPLNQY